MTFRGTMRNGKIELDEESPIPDGARVHVQLDKQESLLDVLLKHTVRDDELPKDYATEVDHYLYGTPKCFTKRTRKAAGSPTARKSSSKKGSGAATRAKAKGRKR